ncbi:MAG: caa(3)-type oxidase subunit 4 [Desulfobulbaceae bacterium]|nr:MAG: caa(3)-type oxidase subunit 4 [Desulfobulbaceae bacterium]
MSEHEVEHQLSYGFLALILAGLIVLTGVTVGVSYIDWGFLNVPIALFVASSKATLVLLFFMHIKYEGLVIKVSFISTMFFLAIMISFTFWDVAFR